MGEIDLLQLARQVLVTSVVVSMPILVLVAVIGLAISLIQALTQVQEQTLSFVPKLLAGIGCLLCLGSWMLTTMVDLATNLLSQLSKATI